MVESQEVFDDVNHFDRQPCDCCNQRQAHGMMKRIQNNWGQGHKRQCEQDRKHRQDRAERAFGIAQKRIV